MKTTFVSLFVLATLVGLGWWCRGSSQEPSKTDAKASEERIARLIADLDDDSFLTRQQATQELEQIGVPALPQLKKALNANPSLEVRVRLGRLVDRLAIYDGGGEVVNGLKIKLTADKESIRLGEKVRFVTALCNMTRQEVNVYVGYGFSTSDVVFQSGRALRLASVKDGVVQELQPQQWYNGCICGFDGPLFVTLPALSYVEYRTEMAFDARPLQQERGLSEKKMLTGYFITQTPFSFLSLETPPLETHRLRMIHTVTEKNKPIEDFPGDLRPPNERALFWIGTIRSNDLEIKVQPQ